jgi:hypothetical protein
MVAEHELNAAASLQFGLALHLKAGIDCIQLGTNVTVKKILSPQKIGVTFSKIWIITLVLMKNAQKPNCNN